MKAIIVQAMPDHPLLTWADAPDVVGGPEEVIVDVRASAVNRADLSQARGHYPPPPGASPLLGLEMAGVIRQLGSQVAGWQIGDRVCALLAGGGYAEQTAVHHAMLLRLPDAWTFAQGAAVPEVWYTAFINLCLEGGLQAGETALIHAGASGVGTAAIQLTRAWGARAFVTAGSEAKLARCQALGAELAINYKAQDFAAVVLAATHGAGVDVILDPVGGPYLAHNVRLLKPFGRLVTIGLLGGAEGQLDMAAVLRRRLRIVGSTLRNRPLAEKVAITRQFRTLVWPRLISGELKPIIDTTFPMPAAQAAHDYVRRDQNVGKVILTLGE